MTPVIRQVWLFTRYEFQDALRSRRAWVVLGLFWATALLTMNGFLSILLRLENELAETLLLPAADKPGAVINALWESDRFQQMVARSVQSDTLVSELVGLSPIALVFAGLLFFYTPLLVALVAPVRVAEEWSNGTVRFVVFRAPRWAWSAGKVLGQAGLLLVALSSSALAAWGLMRLRMIGAEDWTHAWQMGGWALRAWFYGFAFLGLLMGLAPAVRSPSRCTGLALLLLFLVTLAAWAADRYAAETGWRAFLPFVRALLPQGHSLSLWRQSAAHFVPAALFLLALGTGYSVLGYAWLRRRDI